MQHPYDSSGRFGPTPAPAVDIGLEWKGRRTSRRALVDTGASGTLIPFELYQALGLQKTGDEEDIGGVRDARAVPTVLNLTFEGIPFPNFPVMAITSGDLPIVLIGRDLLNRYLLECNGPSLEFSIAQP